MWRLPRRRLLGSLGAAVSLSGCPTTTPRSGGTETPTGEATPTETPYEPTLHGGRPEAPADAATIGMTCLNRQQRFYFVPSLVWVTVGGSVTWTAQSQCRQRTAAYHPRNDRRLRMPEKATPWSSSVFQGSGSFTHTLEEPGVYDAFGLYEKQGQVATIVVGTPTLDAQPAFSASDDTLPAAARTQLALHHEAVREMVA